MTTIRMIKTRFWRHCVGGRSQRSLRKPIAALALLLLANVAHAQSTEAFVAETRLFAMGWCPKNWTMASGQVVAVQQNMALYSLLGTTYGGNGMQTFGVPDLRGRSPVGLGNGPGLSGSVIGQLAGAEDVVLSIAQIPAHNHRYIASGAPATHATPATGRMLAQAQNGGLYAMDDGSSRVTTASSSSGGNGRVPVRDPFLVMTWCTAVTGIYPPRP